LPPRLANEVTTPLREALEREGMSQSALARALGVERQQARTWITGEHTPAPERRKHIAAVVGVPVEELWPDAEMRAA
jgi:transcriptional regulator with XRE-family HTH domain